MIVIVLSALIAFPEESDWTVEKILNNPEEAKSSWHTIPSNKKEILYQDERVLKQFSEFFANENGIKRLSLDKGSPIYDGINLVNGDSKLPVFALKNAEVVSLDSGGFKIKFPKGTDLSELDFDGSRLGISFEGENLKLNQGLLTEGAVAVFSDHFRIEPNSRFTSDKVEFKTESKSFDLYYGAVPEKNNFIQIDSLNKKIRIVGDDINSKFLEGNQFEELSVNGKINIINGDIALKFDGKGNGYELFPFGEGESELTVIDKNAPDKKYMMFPGEKLNKVDDIEGFGGCGSNKIDGYSIFDITGRVSQSLCTNPVYVGFHTTQVRLLGSNVDISKNDFYINEEQAKKVKELFIKNNPDISNEQDYVKLISLIDANVNDMGISTTFLRDMPAPEWYIRNYVNEFIRNSKLELNADEKSQVPTYIEILKNMDKGDILNIEIKGPDQALVSVNKNGKIESYKVSYRVARLFIREQYSDLSARGYLQSFFPKQQRVAQKPQ